MLVGCRVLGRPVGFIWSSRSRWVPSRSVGEVSRVRTRIAPSPTGKMHLGGLRTALFNYLFAKQNKGDFILRIEDTDQTRIVEGSQDNIIEVLKWSGVVPDEGPDVGGNYGPYVQSLRLPIYQKYANELVNKGYAYRCYCTAERLEEMRTSQVARGLPTFYDRYCLSLKGKELDLPYTIRFKIPEGNTVVEDLVLGTIHYKNSFIDDQVLLKSDGFPTYHLANVVDDHLMQISHVIRGEEWLNSTPKHILLYKAFGWNPPIWAHLPLLLNKDKTKLSKRHGDVSVNKFMQDGILPSALINFIVLLGWNPGLKQNEPENQEIFTMDELIQRFSLNAVNKGGSVVTQEKLDWFNSKHLQLLIKNSPDQVVSLFEPLLLQYMKDHNLSLPATYNHDYLKKVLAVVDDRYSTLQELVQLTLFFFVDPEFNMELINKVAKQVQLKEVVPRIIQNFSVEDFRSGITSLASELKTKPSVLFTIVRIALTGREKGLDISHILQVLGPQECKNRLQTFNNKINNPS